MKAIYFNDLRKLPNFGCRSTGAALEDIICSFGVSVDRVEGLDSVNNSGWDAFANRAIRLGGPKGLGILYRESWRRRSKHPKIFRTLSRFDAKLGALHDYVCDSPSQSVDRFLALTKQGGYFSQLHERILLSDVVIINGEGTLIFSRNTKRDALYLLFLIETANRLNKPVYLLNAMITSCPYEPPSLNQIRSFAKTLEKCTYIAVREEESLAYASKVLGIARLQLVPDALFTWHSKYRWLHDHIGNWADSTFFYDSEKSLLNSLKHPYITLSASSSAWRYGKNAVASYTALAMALQEKGFNVVLVETCAGDGLLRRVARDLYLPLATQDLSLDKLSGVLSGSSLFISGRYHPGIASYCAGVPCLFMGSNSHKTVSLQNLVGIDAPIEYGASPSPKEIESIVEKAEEIMAGLPRLPYAPAFEIINELSSEVRNAYHSIFH